LRPTRFLTVADIRLQRSDLAQVRNRGAVLCRALGIRIAHTKAYIFRRVVTNIVHHCSERRVTRFERHEHSRVRFDGSRRVVAMYGASLVKDMHPRPKSREDGKMGTL